MIENLPTAIENLPATTPNITDIAQAVAACIGIPLTVITLYKLMRKDKERENEIRNLGAIANQLYINQLESEKRYKASKNHILQSQQLQKLKIMFYV